MGIDWNKYVSPTAKWTRRNAPMALEVLLDSAKVPGTTLTYERLAQVLFERYGEPEMHNKQHYGKALGAAAAAIMGEAKDGGITVPPITVIVVSKAYGYASRGADQFVDGLKKGNYEENDPRRQEILKKEFWRGTVDSNTGLARA